MEETRRILDIILVKHRYKTVLQFCPSVVVLNPNVTDYVQHQDHAFSGKHSLMEVTWFRRRQLLSAMRPGRRQTIIHFYSQKGDNNKLYNSDHLQLFLRVQRQCGGGSTPVVITFTHWYISHGSFFLCGGVSDGKRNHTVRCYIQWPPCDSALRNICHSSKTPLRTMTLNMCI